ncbi:hypothetical protein O3M35_011002 [Rhynocoris fuscipes]|uniref:Uncharacterized protein n=1 Tax=Rhynocoris fuscipes TaxID=488301 RepID=A0AAW1D207_9HEMI
MGTEFGGVRAQLRLASTDILNAHYLPSTLLLQENNLHIPVSNLSTDGHIRDAFNTMQYHRSMMNEYLCHNYVAQQILDTMESNSIARLGKPALPNKSRVSDHLSNRHKVLLSDQGSSAYQQWLSRSKSLDGFYRDYGRIDDRDDEVELESGDVTGYAVHSGTGTSAGSSKPPSHSYPQNHYHSDLDTVGAGDSHHHGPLEEIPYSSGDVTGYGGGDEHYYYEAEEHSSGKGLQLKDLFDLALTALAFLAFGLFILNLIMMCITGGQGTVIIMQTSTMTTTSTGAAREPLPFSFVTKDGSSTRTRRNIHSEELLNDMAYRVMLSIDKLMKLNESTDECLEYSLCQNNRYSRELNGHARIWLPIWSFGVSWLAGFQQEDRVGLLKASVLGLGNADCSHTFPSCPHLKHY